MRQFEITRLLLSALALYAAHRGFADEADYKPPELPPGFRVPDRSMYRQGKAVYEQHCIICHGKHGDGKGEMAHELAPKPRDFSSADFKYRTTPYGKLPTTDDLLRTVREGRSGTAMGIFAHLPEADLRAVVEYIKFFSRKWRKAENYAPTVEIQEPPGWFEDQAELKRRAARGSTLFTTACASCHGPTGAGDGPAAAALRTPAGDPTTPADLRQPRLRSGPELRDIYRTITTGLSGTPMVGFENTFSDEQRWELVAYVLSLRDRPK
jgi:cytochrome c oxidase cbb3-type subunit I/II